MSDICEEIRQRILASVPVKSPTPKQRNGGILLVMLGCTILLLTFAIFVAVVKRNASEAPVIVSEDNLSCIQIAQLQHSVEKLDKRLAENNKKIDYVQRCTWLLALAHNENVYQ